jgi:hypothetical protein
MKHILNDLTEQEKNSIREQHQGGMKVMTKNFSKLVNSKLGDSKPLIAEQRRLSENMEGGIGVNEVMNLAYHFMSEHCPEGPKDKMKYAECIGGLQDIFGMVIRNLKGNIAGSSGVQLESKRKFVSEQSQLNITKGTNTSGEQYDIKSPFKVGQTIKGKRSTDGQIYTITVGQVGNGFIYGKIVGPGTYNGKPLKTDSWELNTNTPGKLHGNDEMGTFTIVTSGGINEQIKPTRGTQIQPIQIKIGEFLVTLTTMEKTGQGSKFYGQIRGDKGYQEVLFSCGRGKVQMKKLGDNTVKFIDSPISPEGLKLLNKAAGCDSYVSNQDTSSDMV